MDVDTLARDLEVALQKEIQLAGELYAEYSTLRLDSSYLPIMNDVPKMDCAFSYLENYNVPYAYIRYDSFNDDIAIKH